MCIVPVFQTSGSGVQEERFKDLTTRHTIPTINVKS